MRGERGNVGRGWSRIIDDPFVCFATKDFESIAACVDLPGPGASARGEETSSRMWKTLMKPHLSL